jgi:hypothetical protein
VDLTSLPTFTIDPDDARDFDDAVSARREDGHVRVWVHIADVTAYVRPGGPLEREAFRRGTSVYVPGAVEPMLPEVLSNSACSLRPGEDRLAVTVEMEVHGADVRSVAFHRSLVRSDKRLTYGEVDEVFAGRARAGEPWAAPLEAARVFYNRTFASQLERESPFSIWDWGQYHARGVPDLSAPHQVVKALVVVAAVAVAFVPRRKSPLQLAALTAAVLIAFELVLTHWFYLYLPWFLPFVAFAVLAAPPARSHRSGSVRRSRNPPSTSARGRCSRLPA